MSRRKRKQSRPTAASAAQPNKSAAPSGATAGHAAVQPGVAAAGRRSINRWQVAEVVGRNLLALAALMAFGAFLGALGAGLVIVLYTALMIYTDLYPERFLRWFDGLGSGRAGDGP